MIRPGITADLGLGPVAYLDGNMRELLVRWMGTPCGPVVTLDVAKELSAIRVLDRTPGCDAAGVGYAVVLRLKGSVPSLIDIDGTLGPASMRPTRTVSRPPSG